MTNQAKASLFIGLLFLILTIINSLLEIHITPSFQRAELLAGITSTLLMLFAFISTGAKPKLPSSKLSKENLGLEIHHDLKDVERFELAWGTQLLLTATPAATILVYWDDKTLIRRGILGRGDFLPASTCFDVRNRQKLLSLPNTKFFPAKSEFDSILENLPSVIIYPLLDRGWVIIGGNTERCFSISDEKWIKGWSDRLTGVLVD